MNESDLPTLSGSIPYPVEQAIRMLARANGELSAKLAAIPAPSQNLTLDQIRKALSATGRSPVNIFELVGGSGTSGSGVIKFVTHATRIATPPSTVGVGTTWYETDRNALYSVQLVGPTFVWTFIGQATPLSGTLAPNQKPTDLTTTDVGFLFASTDFAREYVWTGAAWVDAPGQPTRGAITYFTSQFGGATGWQLCDGSSVTVSRTDATTSALTVPDLTTANRFLRSVSGTTGGTGGSATTHTHSVDPPNTTSSGESTGHTHSVDPPNTATSTENSDSSDMGAGGNSRPGTGHVHAVDIAAFTSGAVSNDHTHDVNIAAFASAAPSGAGGDDALPPYMNLRPYIRL